MAIYPYLCGKCGKEQEVWQSIASYSQAPNVPECCGGLMTRFLTVPMTVTDEIAPFESTIDGEMITSKSQRREHMAKHGVAPFDEVMPDVIRNRTEILRTEAQNRKQAIVDAYHRVESGYKPQVLPESALIPTE